MTEYDRLHEIYANAREKWLTADRHARNAKIVMETAERERRKEWDKLVQAARELPDEVQKRVADEQFGPAP